MGVHKLQNRAQLRNQTKSVKEMTYSLLTRVFFTRKLEMNYSH